MCNWSLEFPTKIVFSSLLKSQKGTFRTWEILEIAIGDFLFTMAHFSGSLPSRISKGSATEHQPCPLLQLSENAIALSIQKRETRAPFVRFEDFFIVAGYLLVRRRKVSKTTKFGRSRNRRRETARQSSAAL